MKILKPLIGSFVLVTTWFVAIYLFVKFVPFNIGMSIMGGLLFLFCWGLIFFAMTKGKL